MKNFWYLFAAYSVVWLVLFGYLCSLYTRQRRIKQELDALMERLNSDK
jgi:CcmD family protein